jgi:hypothetical protein
VGFGTLWNSDILLFGTVKISLKICDSVGSKAADPFLY